MCELNKFIIFVPYCDVYKDFIIECLESIENQDYSNYEVVIVNDGGCQNILDEYAKKINYTILNLTY